MRTTEQQLKHNDCGISAVKIIYNLHNIHVTRNYIEENIYLNENGSSLHDIKDFFFKQHFNPQFNILDVNSLKFSPQKLRKYLPCILPVKNKNGLHYIVIQDINRNKFSVFDPAKGRKYTWGLSEVMNHAYIATTNYDYASNSQLLEAIINEEIVNYQLDPSAISGYDTADVINKLTYFTYLKENFGFSNPEAEKNFLNDLLFNQQLNILPKQFRTLKLNEAKLRISAPVVLSITKPQQVLLPTPAAARTERPVNSYRRLANEMKPYRKVWGIYIMAALFAAFMAQLTIFSSQILIDNILPSYNLNLLVLFAIGLGFFRVFNLILSLYKNFISIHLANIFDNFFLSSFIEKLNTFSIRYIQSFSRGDLSERVKDSTKLKTFFMSFFTGIIIDAFVAAYSLVILFVLNWKVSLIVLAILLIFTIWFYLVTPYIRENEKRRFLEKSNLYSSIFENIDGLQVIKSFRIEGAVMQRLAPKIQSILGIQRKVRYVSLVNSGIVNFIIIIASMLILVFLSKSAILDKSISVGQIITFIALSYQVFSAVSGILDQNLDLQENEIILDRYFDFSKVEKAGEVPLLHKKIQNFKLESIEFRGVAFYYIPQRPVFTDLNIVINIGDKIKLEGSNGAGKSTFCKVLSLLYTPDSGNIFINNERYQFYNSTSLRKKILLVSNEDILFNDTLGYNISFDYNTNTTQILALAKEVGLYDFIAERAEGLDFIITEQGKNISTGQRKKILMMRALLSDADLMILDETLSGIDHQSKEKIEKYLNAETARSFIIISHEPLVHLKFNKIYKVQNGSFEQLQLHCV